jgi:hypothetical protein
MSDSNPPSRPQQFKIVFTNKLLDCPLSLHLYIDGLDAVKIVARPGQSGDIRGLYKTQISILPFQFRELELVGMLSPPFFFFFFALCIGPS